MVRFKIKRGLPFPLLYFFTFLLNLAIVNQHVASCMDYTSVQWLSCWPYESGSLQTITYSIDFLLFHDGKFAIVCFPCQTDFISMYHKYTKFHCH